MSLLPFFFRMYISESVVPFEACYLLRCPSGNTNMLTVWKWDQFYLHQNCQDPLKLFLTLASIHLPRQAILFSSMFPDRV